MASIIGVTTGTGQDVVTASQAARVALYRDDNVPLVPVYAGTYGLRFEIIPSTLTAGGVYWAIRNLGTKRAFIRSMSIKMGFSGTAIASRSIFEIERFRTATPTGGTAFTPVAFDNTYPTSSITDARFSAATLSITGIVFGAPFIKAAITNQLTSDWAVQWTAINEQDAFVIAVNEGLCVRADPAVAPALGCYLIGSIQWSERI